MGREIILVPLWEFLFRKNQKNYFIYPQIEFERLFPSFN
ncbi:hypothetical protein DJ66_1192 [Candidatus Liberibacter solanacearum]|uniref:Uncharacterized protein n=1 Tax=Candidatus Liberibacter solanacearum TaxID=556287 RepID=A0A0F4VII4_9HYPH|nr:hypothetical protein DJ66_1192 [Candidatus Liberibacter solanacearum]